jgi:hypothetical protein
MTTKKTEEIKKDLSFNKRISLVKKYVFENLKETKELDNIKGTNTIGFYSLSTIEKYLFPALDMYDLDLDLEIFSDKIIGHWYDCAGDNQRNIEIDFSRIEHVEKLQLMANMVQSEGAVKSYTRRYALTAILRLPSTDLIDSDFDKNNFRGNDKKDNGKNTGNNNKAAVQTGQNNQGNKSAKDGKKVTPAKDERKVTPPQLKRYFAIARDKGFDTNYLDELIKVAYSIPTKNDWLKSDYDAFTKYMEGNTMQDTHNVLIAKIKKAGKPVPGKK